MGDAVDKLEKMNFQHLDPDLIAKKIVDTFNEGKTNTLDIGKEPFGLRFWNSLSTKFGDTRISKIKSKLNSALNGISSETNKVIEKKNSH